MGVTDQISDNCKQAYIDKLEQGAKLLIKWPLSIMTPLLKKKALAKKPRPRRKPRKNLVIEPITIVS